VAWRESPSYHTHVTNISGPCNGTIVTGSVVQGVDGIHYLQVGSYFIPFTSPLGVPVLIEAPRPDTAPPPAMDPINVGVPTQSLQQEPPALAESSEKKQSILKSKVKKNKKKKTEEV